nr:formate dehydrogenase accessory sulfurtransferase FdhD [Euryarchaeota archaeon]
MAEEATKITPVQVWSGGEISTGKDSLVSEAAIEILIDIDGEQKKLGILLRTPGEDAELVTGWLLGEAIIQSKSSILGIESSPDRVVVVMDPKKFDLSDFNERKFPITSSCGLCGRETLDGLIIPSRLTISDEQWVSPEVLTQLPQRLTDSQDHFKTTGGLHACALFDYEGNLISVREDVGRHNALDKLIGSRLIANGLPAEKQILMLSGRIGYELIQKAALAGIPVIAGLGAPSTMAVDAAREAGLTLIGFLRSNRFNVHTGAWRLIE